MVQPVSMYYSVLAKRRLPFYSTHFSLQCDVLHFHGNGTTMVRPREILEMLFMQYDRGIKP